MPTPKKKPNGSWEVTVFIGSDPLTGKKKYRHLTAPTRGELLDKIRDMEDETPKTIDALSLTVGEAVDSYIDRRSSELSPSTLANYRKYRRESFPDLMPLKLGQLTDDICQRSIDLYSRTRSPKTVLNRWNLVYASIREAKRNLVLYVRLPSVKRKRLDMPDDEPLLHLFQEIENTPLEIPVLLAAICGLRRSEICALDFSEDVDYDRSLIFVNKALVMDEHNHYVLKDTKTTAGERAVPCPSWVLDKLAQARDNPKYVRYMPNTITCQFTPLARQFGVHCSFHGLRHYYASIMSALNIPEQYQMERMGHASPYMLKRYQEYLKSKEVSINHDLMSALTKLNPRLNSSDNAKDNAN